MHSIPFHKVEEPEDGQWILVTSPIMSLTTSSMVPDDAYIHLLFEVGKNAEQGTEITVAFIGPVLKSKPLNVKKKLSQ